MNLFGRSIWELVGLKRQSASIFTAPATRKINLEYHKFPSCFCMSKLKMYFAEIRKNFEKQ